MANILLGSHYEKFVQDQVASGRYRDETEVVLEGLRLVEQRELKLARLRQDIQEGLASEGSYTEEEVRAYIAELSAAERQEA